MGMFLALASKPGGSGKDDEDVINLVDESEALELVEFNPSVNPNNSWISAFLDKHFNRALSDSEREAIMKDFLRPTYEAMTVPKLDAEVKDQLKKKGKDPHFGAEKSLYKVALQSSGATFGRGRPPHLPVGRLVEQRSQHFG